MVGNLPRSLEIHPALVNVIKAVKAGRVIKFEELHVFEPVVNTEIQVLIFGDRRITKLIG